MNELLSIDRLSMAVYNETTHKLEYTSNPVEDTAVDELPIWRKYMENCFEQQEYISEKGIQTLPLVVDAGNMCRCIGVLCLERRKVRSRRPTFAFGLIARYVSIVIFNAVVKLATKYRDIEVAQDEARRASWEDSLLHVQNMVLDNCLSTIKHETIYIRTR